MKVLVTGVAGFIGYSLACRLLESGDEIIGIDNLNDYYDVNLKKARLAILSNKAGFSFVFQDITDAEGINRLFDQHLPDKVMHLAAQAGVRYSLVNPQAYINANITGFLNILEACRHYRTSHLAFASTSSVYGLNTQMPFSIHKGVDHPVSLYGATKKANELMAHSYSHLFRMPVTGLRFFTVYGPWGRPDMALFLFTEAILKGKPIDVFNQGQHVRDFTYISDIVDGLFRVLKGKAPEPDPKWQSHVPDPASSSAPYRIYNIGNHRPEKLLRYIEVLEECLGKKAEKNLLPMQPGDVEATFADVEDLTRDFGYQPTTSIEAGVGHFVKWYREYYGV